MAPAGAESRGIQVVTRHTAGHTDESAQGLLLSPTRQPHCTRGPTREGTQAGDWEGLGQPGLHSKKGRKEGSRRGRGRPSDRPGGQVTGATHTLKAPPSGLRSRAMDSPAASDSGHLLQSLAQAADRHRPLPHLRYWVPTARQGPRFRPALLEGRKQNVRAAG